MNRSEAKAYVRHLLHDAADEVDNLSIWECAEDLYPDFDDEDYELTRSLLNSAIVEIRWADDLPN